MNRQVIFMGLFTAVVMSLAAGTAGGALSTDLVNGDFNMTSPLQAYDRTLDGWEEHEIYVGPGKLGNGVGANPPSGVEGTVDDALMLILGSLFDDPPSSGPNSATASQSIGTVDAADIGNIYSFSAGAVAWDWFGPPVTPFTGIITLSFREGVVPDDPDGDPGTPELWGDDYGTLLGTADTITTSVTAGDGTQNDIGDEGGLHDMMATYIPGAGDVGKEVFVVINLGHGVTAPEGESRFLVDNAVVSLVEADADFDEDGDVDGTDFLIWQRGNGSPGGLNEGDANGDSNVDGADLELWEALYGIGGGSLVAAASSVPEPASISLAALVLAILTTRRHRAPPQSA